LTAARASQQTPPQVISVEGRPPDTRRGGDIRTLLSPRTVGSTSGFMGVATIAGGDWIAEHYHPYSEEFVYVVTGTVTAELDGVAHEIPSRHGVCIPVGVRHRLRNLTDSDAEIVFHLGPLAPRPELGHVDTEQRVAEARLG
jgi:putative monooxygenase